MASGITVKIKLDPFYQEFLRGQHTKQETDYFMFDKGSDLSVKLQILLSKPPENFIPSDFGKDTFEIELPYNELKNVESYNYISKRNNATLNYHIDLYFKTIFHEEMNKLRNLSFQKKQAVFAFMSNYNISPEYYDRLIKNYQRWLEKITRIKASKKKLKKQVS